MAAEPPILLIQIRDDPRAENQERICFLESSGQDATRFAFHNLVRQPRITWEDVARYEVLLIGGAGKHSVTQRYPFTEPLSQLVRRWVDTGRPLFGSCFGHQFLAWAMGGEVVTDLERRELGTHVVELTEAGRHDPLFEGTPARFDAQFGHHDRVVELPPGATELARTHLCPYQAFRIDGLPVWGCQFHVELDVERLKERARFYQDGYLPNPKELERFDRSLRPSPWASLLLRQFFNILNSSRLLML